MSARIAIVSSNVGPERTSNLARLAEFMGLEAAPFESLTEAVSSRCEVVALPSSMLATAAQRSSETTEIDSFLTGFKAAFVYGFPPGVKDTVARRLTRHAFSGTNEIGFPGVEYRFSFDRSCRQLRGLQFQTAWDKKNRAFQEAASSDSIVTLIAANERPYFGRMRRGRCEIFL